MCLSSLLSDMIIHIHYAELAKEFLTIVEKSPTRLKKRIQENFKMAVEVNIKLLIYTFYHDLLERLELYSKMSLRTPLSRHFKLF